MTEKTKINLGTFDLIKGIAMLGVIFVHMQYRYSVERMPMLLPVHILYGIMGQNLMPVFFIISGYGFKEKAPKKILKKTVNELIVPYLCTIPILVILCFFLNWPVYKSQEILLKNISLQAAGLLLGLPVQKTVLGYVVKSAGALWFFLALFISENVLNLILKCKSFIGQGVLAGLSVLIGFMLIHTGFIFYCIPQGLAAVGFCYVGYILKNKRFLDTKLHDKKIYAILMLICLIQFGTAIRSGNGFSLTSGGFTILEYLMAGCCGILFVLLGIQGNQLKFKWLKWIKKIGMYSYWIIIIHTIEMLAVPWDAIAAQVQNEHMMFAVEVVLKILILMTGCEIMKKMSQIRYKKKLEKRGSAHSGEK